MEANTNQPLTIKEAAASCRVSTVTVLNWIKGNNRFGKTLNAFRARNLWRIMPEDLDRFIHQG